jgi:hypothetical protein
LLERPEACWQAEQQVADAHVGCAQSTRSATQSADCAHNARRRRAAVDRNAAPYSAVRGSPRAETA